MSALELALPLSVITEPGVLRLVAGEDLRFTFRQGGIDEFGAALVEALRRPLSRAGALSGLPPEAGPLLDRMIAERLVTAVAAPTSARSWSVTFEGDEPLAGHLRAALPDDEAGAPLRVLAQATLDYAAARAFARDARRSAEAWLWVTEGPVARAFVSPVFADDGGPCLGCLLAAFRRLSPAPEIHDALTGDAAADRALVPAGFDDAGRRVLAGLAALKLERAATEAASAHALHVFERQTLEVSAHPLAIDPDCSEHDA